MLTITLTQLTLTVTGNPNRTTKYRFEQGTSCKNYQAVILRLEVRVTVFPRSMCVALFVFYLYR